ncbi:hypothetical protein [Microbispora sp. NPDC049125]|uniref:hypothetical protein n=1 Tax=Microbispora sp. NPDC049125 TaxID=3154929 RepID=UPI00346628A9
MELFRNVEIDFNQPGSGKPAKMYANVTEDQYEILVDRDNLEVPAKNLVMPLYAQLTPTGDVGHYILRLSYVTGVKLWEPPPDSGIAREWPERV